jgi:hypothetical protein
MNPSWATPEGPGIPFLLMLSGAFILAAAILCHRDRKARDARRKAREEYLRAQEKTYLPWLESEFAAKEGREP